MFTTTNKYELILQFEQRIGDIDDSVWKLQIESCGTNANVTPSMTLKAIEHLRERRQILTTALKEITALTPTSILISFE
jgi:hypothetical protein